MNGIVLPTVPASAGVWQPRQFFPIWWIRDDVAIGIVVVNRFNPIQSSHVCCIYGRRPSTDAAFLRGTGATAAVEGTLSEGKTCRKLSACDESERDRIVR